VAKPHGMLFYMNIKTVRMVSVPKSTPLRNHKPCRAPALCRLANESRRCSHQAQERLPQT